MGVDEIKALLQTMIDSQNRMLAKMERIEDRFEQISSRIEEVGQHQVRLEKEFGEFRAAVFEQVSRQFMRRKDHYH